MTPKSADGRRPRDARRARRRERFLCDALDPAASLHDEDVLVRHFVEAAARRFCDVCAIRTRDENGALHLVGPADAADAPAASSEQLLREIVRTGEPRAFVRGALRSGPFEEHATQVLEATGMRSLVIVPLSVGTARVGTLTFLEATEHAAYDVSDLDCALAAAHHLGLSIENVRFREQQRKLAERSRFLARATDQLFATVDQTEMLRLLLDVVVEDVADWAAVVGSGGSLKLLASAESAAQPSRRESSRKGRPFSEPAEHALHGALQRQRAMIVEDPAAPESEARAWMIVPLVLGSREYGAVVCSSRSRRYVEADLEVLQELARRTSLALEYAESFARERRLTQTLQQATMPSNLAHPPNASLSAAYLPAAEEEQVGGDWYDAFELEDDRILLTVGDVTGHGLQASVIMGKLRHALNVVALYESDPVRILDVAEAIVLRRYPNALSTAFVAVMDTKAETVTYANAGHPRPIVRMRDGTVRTLAADGVPIGVRRLALADPAFTEGLRDVELLVLYTDGLTEAAKDPLAGERRLMEVVAREEAVLLTDAAEFVKASCIGGGAADDVAVLALNFVRMDRWSFASTEQGPAQAARREFCERLRARGIGADDCATAELIFGEITGNVANHAPGPVYVALDWRSDEPVLHVIDRGTGYELHEHERETADAFAESGRGLWLVQHLGGDVRVDPLPQFGTHTSVVLPLRAPELRLAGV